MSNPPHAIIKWPEGLSGVPVLYPMGDSFEQSEKIRELFAGLFENKQN